MSEGLNGVSDESGLRETVGTVSVVCRVKLPGFESPSGTYQVLSLRLNFFIRGDDSSHT